MCCQFVQLMGVHSSTRRPASLNIWGRPSSGTLSSTLLPVPGLESRRILPPRLRRLIEDLKAEHSALNLNEAARIC